MNHSVSISIRVTVIAMSLLCLCSCADEINQRTRHDDSLQAMHDDLQRRTDSMLAAHAKLDWRTEDERRRDDSLKREWAVWKGRACRLLADFPNSIPIMISQPDSLSGGTDSCWTTLVDSLFARYEYTSDKQALAALNSAAVHADGCHSEHLSYVLARLFLRSAPMLVADLQQADQRTLSDLREQLVMGMQMEIEYSQEFAEQLDSTIGHHIAGEGLPRRQKRYLARLHKEFHQQSH